MNANLYDIEMFHSDLDSEFINMTIDQILEFFKIDRSVSRKSTPWDNAVA